MDPDPALKQKFLPIILWYYIHLSLIMVAIVVKLCACMSISTCILPLGL